VDYFKVLLNNVAGRTEKNNENIRITNLWVEIRTQGMQSTKQEYYEPTERFCKYSDGTRERERQL
jgi:hypothetical protein